MTRVALSVDSRDAISARFVAAMHGETQGAFITFATPELLFQTLTLRRWQLIKAMTGAGPLSIRELARRLGRDVRSVHDDVNALLDVGMLERSDDRSVAFPYDAVRVKFTICAADPAE